MILIRTNYYKKMGELFSTTSSIWYQKGMISFLFIIMSLENFLGYNHFFCTFAHVFITVKTYLMKQKLLFICCLLNLLGVIIIQAQPSQRLVSVVISPERADWKYKAQEDVIFKIQVFKDNVLMKDVSVDYEIGPEFFPTEKKENVVLKNGEITLRSSMKAPGFLRCRVIAKVDSRRYEGMATVGYDIEKIQPTTAEPKDFDDFWSNTIAEARKTPLNPKMILLPERCTSTQNVYEVSFQNERPGSRIYGILITPKAPGKYPAVLQVPGDGIRPYGGANLGDGIITLEIGIHGISVTQPHYFRNAKPQPNEMETLAYFDVVNFARRVKAPGWYSCGFNDDVCPPTSMYAAYNVITGEKEIELYPITGHWTFPEQSFSGNEWLRKNCKK